jgi:hypothetical protein
VHQSEHERHLCGTHCGLLAKTATAVARLFNSPLPSRVFLARGALAAVLKRMGRKVQAVLVVMALALLSMPLQHAAARQLAAPAPTPTAAQTQQRLAADDAATQREWHIVVCLGTGMLAWPRAPALLGWSRPHRLSGRHVVDQEVNNTPTCRRVPGGGSDAHGGRALSPLGALPHTTRVLMRAMRPLLLGARSTDARTQHPSLHAGVRAPIISNGNPADGDDADSDPPDDPPPYTDRGYNRGGDRPYYPNGGCHSCPCGVVCDWGACCSAGAQPQAVLAVQDQSVLRLGVAAAVHHTQLQCSLCACTPPPPLSPLLCRPLRSCHHSAAADQRPAASL